MQVTKWTRACDKHLARLISYIHYTCEFKTILSCGKYGTTMQIRIVSGFRFCRRSRRLNINIKWTLVHFRKSNICANVGLCKKQTSVTHSSTEAEIISLDTGLRMDDFQLLIFGIWLKKCFILPQTNSTTPKVKYRETSLVIPHQTSTPKTKPGFQPARQF